MKVSVKADKKTLRQAEEMLGEFHKRAPSAIARALNRATTTVNSEVKKETKKRYVIKAGDIQKTLTKTKANKGKLGAEVRSTGEVIALDKFKVSPKTINPKRKSAVKVAVKKGGSPKPVQGAFMAEVNGAKLFKKTGEKRLPIRRLFGPSVPQMIENEDIREEINKVGQETFDKRLEHEVTRILEKGRAK